MFQRIALVHIVLERHGGCGHFLRETPDEPILLLVVRKRKLLELFRRIIVDVASDALVEAAIETGSLGLVPGKEIARKRMNRIPLDAGKHVADFKRKHVSRIGQHPFAQRISHILAGEDRHGVKKHTRTRHRAADHLLWLAEEVEVVRLRVRNRHVERAAVRASGTAHALDKLTLRRRHAAQKHARKVADVNAHLKRRRR